MAVCFREFYEMIRSMVEGSWMLYLRRVNTQILEQDAGLKEFLFGAERTAFSPELRSGLTELQEGCCFYCGREFQGKREVHVDHFIPWSRYPADLGFNFVLADAACNSAKTDLLADERHLERWVERNTSKRKSLEEIFDIQHYNPSLKVAGWAYAQADLFKAGVWSRGKKTDLLSGSWKALLGSN